MRFLDLYESDKPKQNASAEKKDDNQKKQEAPAETITMDTIMKDLEGFHTNVDKRVAFLNKIHKPGQQSDRAFTYGGDGSGRGTGGKSISYTADRLSKQPSEEFRKIMDVIKSQSDWKDKITSCIDRVENSQQQQYIKGYFIPKLEDPGIRLNTTANQRDYRVPGVEQYEQFGKALVFYCGKCVSKLTDADVKIGPEKFKLIMQGCFGAAPDQNREDDDFLTQFKNLEAKLKIDAAKNVINSIHAAGTKDIQGIKNPNDIEAESYYTGMSFLVKNKLFEAEEGEEESSGDVECPKVIDDFSADAATALKQAKAVSIKYPKQYKLWYEKLRGAFDKGVKDYQEKERSKDLMKNGIENPITHEIEYRNGKAWGAGGPNAFIRNNPELQKIVDKIKQGTPGCEGVNGWDIFNCGPKLILTMFDALEKGGEIYQKLCDDLAEGSKMIARSLNKTRPEEFDKLIKQYAEKKQHNKAMEIAISGVMLSLTRLYGILANGKIGQINMKTKTFNSENNGNNTVIQLRIDELKNALAKAMKEKDAYEKWLVEEQKKIDERNKKLEEEIKGLKNQSEGEGSKEGENTEEPKKDGISVKKESVYSSVKNILKEEEEQTKSMKLANQAQDELKKKEAELEKSKKRRNELYLLNVKNYIAILEEYKKVLALEKYIKEGYDTINILFDPDSAEEQYQEVVNGTDETSDENEKEDNTKTESLTQRLDKIMKKYRLDEADEGESEASEELDDLDSGNTDAKKTDDKPENTDAKKKDDKPANTETHSDEPEVKSENKGNLDWVERDRAEGLKEIYRIFAEGKHDVRIEVSTFNELAKAKTAKEAFKHVIEACSSLQHTLDRVKTVEPIVDGIVACNKIEKRSDIAGCFEVINFGKDSEEEEKPKEEENKEENKEEKSPAEAEKVMIERLTKCVDESSPLMAGLVGKMNDIVKTAKDDTWIDTYKKFNDETNSKLEEIFKEVEDVVKESDKGKEFVAKVKNNLNNKNALLKIWLTVSMVKNLISSVTAHVKEVEEKSENKPTENASYVPDSTLPKLDEDTNAYLHTINNLETKFKEVDGSIDFNILLPTDFNNEIYNITDASKYNEAEQKLGNIIGLSVKAAETKNKVCSILTTLVRTDDGDNDVMKAVKEKKLPCSKCIEQFTSAPRNNDKERPNGNRNIFYFYGLIRAITACLTSLKGDIKNNNERIVQGEKPQEGQEKKESYIPEVSPNTLMNEIYKYIRGN
jgi:hypothetical protein